jgi:hypothetical protein
MTSPEGLGTKEQRNKGTKEQRNDGIMEEKLNIEA